MKKTTNKYKMSKKCRDSLGLLREIDSWERKYEFESPVRKRLQILKELILKDRNF